MIVKTIHFSILLYIISAIPPAWSGYYDFNNYEAKQRPPKIYYTKILPLIEEESLASKYLNLFLSNPYAATVQTANTESYNIKYRSNLTEISDKCPRDSFFASYNPNHRRAVASLATLYNDQTDFRNLLEVSLYFKTQTEVHPSVWYASLIRGQLSRMPETLQMERPNPINLFPSSFFPQPLITENIQTQQGCLLLDERFGQDNGIENLLWYFREE